MPNSPVQPRPGWSGEAAEAGTSAGTDGWISGAILTNDLDLPNDVVIELLQLLGGNPPLHVQRATNLLYLIAAHERGANLEASDITNPTVFYVPPARDLNRLFLICDGIEDGLLRKTEQPAKKAALPHQLKLLRTGGATQSYGVHVSRFSEVQRRA